MPTDDLATVIGIGICEIFIVVAILVTESWWSKPLQVFVDWACRLIDWACRLIEPHVLTHEYIDQTRWFKILRAFLAWIGLATVLGKLSPQGLLDAFERCYHMYSC
jgi:hypothetical protein